MRTTHFLARLRERARRDDRGQSTAEYLTWMAVIGVIIVAIVSPRVQGIITGLLDEIAATLPG